VKRTTLQKCQNEFSKAHSLSLTDIDSLKNCQISK